MEDMVSLLRRAADGDEGARNQIVQDNLGLVHHVVKRFANWNYEREELFQVGCIGLLKAIDHFDLSYQVQFSTYAVPMIQGEIRRFLRDNGMIKVSRSIKENRYKIEQFKRHIVAMTGKEPTLGEISEQTGIQVEDVVLALNSYCEIESIDEQPICYEFSEKEQILNKVLIGQLLNTLSPLERSLIRMRYFEDKTQCQVAKCLHMTQVQVSRLEKRILLSLRGKNHSGGEGIEKLH